VADCPFIADSHEFEEMFAGQDNVHFLDVRDKNKQKAKLKSTSATKCNKMKICYKICNKIKIPYLINIVKKESFLFFKENFFMSYLDQKLKVCI